MRSYTQLTREQRHQISALLKMKTSHTEIAGLLHVHKSMIGREINRNRGRRGYRPRQVDQKACNRRKIPRRIVRIEWDEVDALKRKDGVRSKFRPGSKRKSTKASATNGSTRIFWSTISLEAIYSATSVAKSSVASVMVAMNGGERFPTG